MFDQKKAHLLVIALIISLLGMVIYYAATHGRVTIKNLGSETVSVVRIDGVSRSEISDIKNGAVLKSGNYVVKNSQGDIDRLASVSIPGWFQTTELIYSGAQSAKISRIASLTYERFFPADNGTLTSFSDLNSYAAGYTSHPTDDAFGGKYTDTSFEKELNSPVITSEGKLLGIHDGQLLRYSFASKALEPFGSSPLTHPTRVQAEEDVTLTPKIKRSSDLNSNRIGIYEKMSSTLKVADTTGMFTNYEVKTDNSRGIAFDINSSGLAIVNTSSETPNDAAAQDEEVPLEYSANIYDPSRKQTSELHLGEAIAISDIALSPTGAFLAALKDGELWIYDLKTSQAVLVHPFTSINQMFWNKNKLYALSSETGMNVFDLNTRQLISMDLGNHADLSFSAFTPVGTKLYTTAYNKKQDSRLPDGYVIDLNLSNDGITDVLARKLPVTSSSYDINYLGSTIYIRINFSPRNGTTAESARYLESLKKRAQTEITELIPADVLKKCTVVFVN